MARDERSLETPDMRSIEGSTYPESLYDSVSRVLIQFSRTLGDLKV